MRWIEVIVILAIFSVFCFAQTTWYVPDDFPTIHGAISDQSVLNGDDVIVRAGTYFENLDFSGKNITLKSEYGPDLTVIDGSMLELSVITFQNGEGKDAIIEGFTLTNGSGTIYSDGNEWGGGVFCLGSSPTIRKNKIFNNTARFGGGIGCQADSTPLIQFNEICNNYASGGGICAVEGSSCLVEYNFIHNNEAIWTGGGIRAGWECKPIIRYNRIENNSAGSDGGGIYITANTEADIYNNIIIGNESYGNGGGGGGGGICLWTVTLFYGTYCHVYNNLILNNISYAGTPTAGGGGIYSRYDTSYIYNNTICGNLANRGGGLCVLTSSYTKPFLSNSILWDNTANNGPEIYLDASTGSAVDVKYCNVKRGWPGTGNINADPLFVDSLNGDYHLTFDSPCMDMGNDLFPYIPLEDFEGNPRTAYDAVDMGADEFYPHFYYTGDATPGGAIQAKFVGLPGKLVNGVIMGVNIFDPPLPCDYGLWYMDNPLQILTGLGTIPATGVSVIPGIIPASPAAPYTIYLQAAIDSWLTNLCPVNVE